MTSCAILESWRGKPDARDDVMVIGQPLKKCRLSRRFLGAAGRLDIIAQCAHIDKTYVCFAMARVSRAE
jgi:hypothetical protein